MTMNNKKNKWYEKELYEWEVEFTIKTKEGPKRMYTHIHANSIDDIHRELERQYGHIISSKYQRV